MNTADVLYKFLKSEVVPLLAGESEITAAIVDGALRAGRRKFASKLSDTPLLQTLGLTDENGDLDAETVGDFFDGVFEERDSVTVTLADLVKLATGVESDIPLLKKGLMFRRADADRLLKLMRG